MADLYSQNDGGGLTIAQCSESRPGIDPLERSGVLHFEWRKLDLQMTLNSDDVPMRVEIGGKAFRWSDRIECTDSQKSLLRQLFSKIGE